jgi:hypothetical protein
MKPYDPDIGPDAGAWLGADEAERLDWVSKYHRRREIRLPNAELHALVHVVIENQIALGEQVVIATLGRLRGEGLDRHDALHAIGSVLINHLFELMQPDADATREPYRLYLAQLQTLTAKSWTAAAASDDHAR